MSEINYAVINYPEIAERLRIAFPGAIRADVDAALANILVAHLKPTQHDIGPVVIRGEPVHIPCRIYFAEPVDISTHVSSHASLQILACLYTRHHNGFIRQKYIANLVEFEDVWILPFVLALVGEYVIEVIEVISKKIDHFPKNVFNEFMKENSAFVKLIKWRIISYWDCYYRKQIPHFEDYIGYQVADMLGMWRKSDIKHLLLR